MMRRHQPVSSGLCFVAALACIASGSATDDAIQADLEGPRLTADKPQSPNLASFNLVYDVRFTNLSGNPVSIPDTDKVPTAIGIAHNGVQAQQSDGSWKSVVNGGTLMWKGDTQFAPCKSLRPQETVEIKGVLDRLFIYKNQLDGLGQKPTVRLSLVLSCRKQNGEVVIKGVQTRPFMLSILAEP